MPCKDSAQKVSIIEPGTLVSPFCRCSIMQCPDHNNARHFLVTMNSKDNHTSSVNDELKLRRRKQVTFANSRV